MNPPLLKVDNEQEIVLDAPRTAAWLVAGALTVVAIAVRWLLPNLWIAPAALMVFAVWVLTAGLQVHRLRLDLERRDYVYRRGFILTSPLRQGSLDEISGIFIDAYEGPGGLAVSRLRSRILTLEFEGWADADGSDSDGSFTLGFPMGPKVAQDLAADYARRLQTQVVDRTGGEERSVSVEEADGEEGAAGDRRGEPAVNDEPAVNEV